MSDSWANFFALWKTVCSAVGCILKSIQEVWITAISGVIGSDCFGKIQIMWSSKLVPGGNKSEETER